MTDQNESLMGDIDPEPERRPVLPGRKYGNDGEATLESIKVAQVKYGRDAGKPCINTRVSILTSEYGHVSQFTDWALDGQRKNYTLKMLDQIGFDMKALKDPSTGRVSLAALSEALTSMVPVPMKVIVDLHWREYDKKDGEGNLTGEKEQANDVRNIWRRP